MTPEKIIWQKEFSIGNQHIDNDHKVILDIYNSLVDIIENKNSLPDDFARILSEMTVYALRHFEKEEAYMRNIKFPNIEDHIQQHRLYVYEVSMFNVNYKISTEIEDVLVFIKDWWIKHIQGEDIRYEAYKQMNSINEIY